jgi:hypothetical protein
VPDLPDPGQSFEVTCPHCKKPFTAALMAGATPRHQGFKCPHCKLFVPYARAEERDLVEPTGST